MWWDATVGSRILSLSLLISFRYAGAAVTNRTIDDEFGDSVTGKKPVFLPTTPGIWEGQECAGCRVQPNRDIAFKGTWNAATFRPEEGGSGPLSIDLSFKGTAIYIFFITANQIAGGIITTLTECNFTLDGQHAGFFQHIPDVSSDMQYNVPGFSRTNMQNTDHTVRISTGGVGYHVFVNFDYAIYTFDDGSDTGLDTTTLSSPPSTPETNSPTPAINPSPSPGSSSTTPGTPPTNPGISSTNPGNFSTNLGSFSTKQGSSSTISGSSSTTLESSPLVSNPVTTSLPDHGKNAPLGAILGGTIGGLALILGAIFLLCVYRGRNNRQKKLELSSATDSAAQNPSAPSRRYNTEAQHQFINPAVPDVVRQGFTKRTPNTGNTSTRSNARLANAPPVTAMEADDTLRTRQMDLQRQLRAAEQGLRDMGVEPHRGLAGPNISPALLQTSAYIEYRRLQAEMEEPPPEYSEG